MRRPKSFHAGLPDLGLAALLGAAWLQRALHFDRAVHDDTFISLRYARHLLLGHGLTFNPGERVEGYTNFLWTVLLAACEGLHLDPVWLAPRLSALASVLLVAAVYRFGVVRGGLPHRGWALVAPALLVAHPLFEAESVGGLETPLFVLLVFVGLARRADEEAGAGSPAAWGAALALATLVRPEGGLLFAAMLLERLARPGGRRAAARALGVYALLVLPHLGFRLAYYHDLVPNTFHAKVGWSAAQVRRGAVYAWEYGAAIVSWPVVLLGVIGVRGGGWRWTAATLAGVHTAYVALVGGDYAPTGRFLQLPLPFLALLVQSALGRLPAALARRGAPRLGVAVPIALGLAAAAWSLWAGGRRLDLRRWPMGYDRDLQARRFMGTWLRTALPSDATVAVGSIGAIGYYSDLRILDTFGLTNAEIGRASVEWMGEASAGHEKGDAGVVLRRAPRVILFDRAFLAPRVLELDEFLSRARSPTEQLLIRDPRFFSAYGLRTVQSPVGVLHFLERVAEATPP